jgi:hypothetical protein
MPIRSTFVRTLLILGLLLPSGCAWLGYAASAMPQKVVARYKGLAGQTVGIMVWDDRALRMDWGSKLQIDLATAIQSKLIAAGTHKDEVEELKGTTFPLDPRSIVRYQRDHPEIEAMNVADVVPKFGVSRVIYVELNDFQTRSPASVDLYRGSASANIRVLEIKDGKATVGYAEDGIEVIYPPETPPEGTVHGSVPKMYVGTIDDLSTKIAQRFFTYEE